MKLCPVLLLMGAVCLAAAPTYSQELPEDHTQWLPEIFRGAYVLVASPAEWQVLDTITGDARSHFLQLFWKRRDPTPTTDRNEFKAQFHERVDYVCTWFTRASGNAPWDPRGDVYIKYGEPDFLENLEVVYNESFAGPGLMVDQVLDDNQVWYYFTRNMILQFQVHRLLMKHVPFMNAYAEPQPRSDYELDRYEIVTDPVEYHPPLEIRRLELAMEIYPFRRDDGGYDVYLALGSPVQPLAVRREDQDVLAYTARIAVFDSSAQRVWEHQIEIDQVVTRPSGNLLVQHQWAADLSSGRYIFGAELESATGFRHAQTAVERWLVPYAVSAELDLSPLVMASDIRTSTDTSQTFVRFGKVIIPKPGRVFARDQDVMFYHEVYNLKPDESGETRYEIAYRLFDRTRESQRLLTSRQVRSPESDTYQAGRIPADQLAQGDYILEVKTRDLIAGATRTALADFRVER